MREVKWTMVNEYGDAKFEFKNITPPDEVEAKAKYDAERPARLARNKAIVEARKEGK